MLFSDDPVSGKESNAIVGPVRWGYDVAVRNYETNQYAGGGGMVRDRRYARALAACLGLGWDTPAGATRATEAVDLPPIIVRASPETAGPIENAVTRTLIERAEIESSEERDLNGLIRGLPGVALQMLGSQPLPANPLARGSSAPTAGSRRSTRPAGFPARGGRHVPHRGHATP